MKRTAPVLVAVLMAVSLTACTPEGPRPRSTESPTNRVSVEDKVNNGKTARAGQRCSVKGATAKSRNGSDLVCARNKTGGGPLRWKNAFG